MSLGGTVQQSLGDPLRILHVSGDFPDPIEPFKTKAIRNLVDLTADRFDHEVVSINRTSSGIFDAGKEAVKPSPLQVHAQAFEYGTALTYEAPARGIRHATKLRQLGQWLAQHIQAMEQKPDLLMGHKLAIEGIVVQTASELCGIPYGLSIQGDSDTKIMDVRRDLTPEFRKVLHGSKVVFPFSPWAWDKVVDRLSRTEGLHHIMLPCATELDQPMPPTMEGSGLISVFHLMSYRRKNLRGLARAMALLETAEFKTPCLSIIGGGDERDHARCAEIVARSPCVRLCGEKSRDEVRQAMNSAIAFVLPSLRESFGLVFIEALFAGLPIIYPKGTAVDGYFDDVPFAQAVDARDPRSIARAMENAIANEAAMKTALAEWQGSDAARRFQRESIGREFACGLTLAGKNASGAGD